MSLSSGHQEKKKRKREMEDSKTDLPTQGMLHSGPWIGGSGYEETTNDRLYVEVVT